jgi:hypothetical protein
LCLICFLQDKAVVALEIGQPLVIRIDPSVMLECLAHGVHVVPHAHEPDIVTGRMRPIAAPARYGLGILPSLFGLINQLVTFLGENRLGVIGYRAFPAGR